MGTLAADPLLSLVDTAFVGRLGSTELAALGVDTALFGFAFAAFNFLAYVTTPLIATARARKDIGAVERVLARALTLAVLAGLTAAMLVVTLAVPLIESFGPDQAVVGPAAAYLRVRALALPSLLIVTVGHGAFRGLQDTRTPLWVTVGANLLNAALDPLLIFGAGLGITGAAWATVGAQSLAALAFLVLLRRRGQREGFSLGLAGVVEALRLLRFGSILMLRTILLVSTLALATSTAARLGTVDVAAHQVVAQLWFLLAMLVDALAIAAQAMIADLEGRGDRAAMVEAGRRLLWWGWWVGVVLGGGLWLTSGRWGPLFTDDAAVRDTIATVVPIAAAMQPVAGLLFVADGIYMGLLRLRRLVASTAAGLAAAGLVFWWTLAGEGSLAGVWWGIGGMVVSRAAVLLMRSPVRRPRAD